MLNTLEGRRYIKIKYMVTIRSKTEEEIFELAKD